jgi:hypothetical protein
MTSSPTRNLQASILLLHCCCCWTEEGDKAYQSLCAHTYVQPSDSLTLNTPCCSAVCAG